MNKADAAALLSLEEAEVHDVLDSPAGALIKTTDGQTYIVVPDDEPDAEGKVGVMFLSAPSPKYGGTLPVYAQPGAEEEIRTIAVAKSFQDLVEADVAGEELEDPENPEAQAAAAAAAAQQAEADAKRKLADAQADTSALVSESGHQDEPAPAPGIEHAEAVEEASTSNTEKAKTAAKKQGARARQAAKKVEKG